MQLTWGSWGEAERRHRPDLEVVEVLVPVRQEPPLVADLDWVVGDSQAVVDFFVEHFLAMKEPRC